MNDIKPNCYECKWRGEIPGNAHSCCNHPLVTSTRDEPLNAVLALLAVVGRIDPSTAGNPLGVRGNPHGVRKGWFAWPFSYDPIWLESCNGFEPKREEAAIGNATNWKYNERE